MAPEFDQWIFADNRQPGDADVVETHFGFHVVYFIEVAAIDWEDRARIGLINTSLDQMIDQLAQGRRPVRQAV